MKLKKIYLRPEDGKGAWKCFNTIDSNSVEFQKRHITIGSGVSIAEVVSIGNGVTIGNDVVIDKDASIYENSVIKDGVHLCFGAYIGEDSVVGQGSVIGEHLSLCHDCVVDDSIKVVCPSSYVIAGSHIKLGDDLRDILRRLPGDKPSKFAKRIDVLSA